MSEPHPLLMGCPLFFFNTPRLRFMLNVELSIAIRKWRGLPRRRWCQYGEEWALVTPYLTSNPCHLATCNIIDPFFLLLLVMSTLLISRPLSTCTAMFGASPNHQVQLDVSLGGVHAKRTVMTLRTPRTSPPPRLIMERPSRSLPWGTFLLSLFLERWDVDVVSKEVGELCALMWSPLPPWITLPAMPTLDP
jgi:hypothetical protein